nr:MAG TPA: hypothetical protein [Caudoviricetes sp.]
MSPNDNRHQIWGRCITRIMITSDSTKLCSEIIFKSKTQIQEFSMKVFLITFFQIWG